VWADCKIGIISLRVGLSIRDSSRVNMEKITQNDITLPVIYHMVYDRKWGNSHPLVYKSPISNPPEIALFQRGICGRGDFLLGVILTGCLSSSPRSSLYKGEEIRDSESATICSSFKGENKREGEKVRGGCDWFDSTYKRILAVTNHLSS